MKLQCVMNICEGVFLTIGELYTALNSEGDNFIVYDDHNVKHYVPKGFFKIIDNPIDSPTHYTHGGIETIDYIKAKLGEGFIDFCMGNVIKYTDRYKYKNGVEDLKKAKKYLEWAIEELNNDKC